MVRKDFFTFFIIIISILLSILILGFFFDNNSDDLEISSAIVYFKDGNNNFYKFRCTIANEIDEISKGLMYVKNLDIDKGMLFVYETPKIVTYWMKNVLIPLDIVFIDENYKIINIEEANVEYNISNNKDFQRYNSLLPIKYVVEINQGLCKKYDIKSGTNVEIKFL
jgi:uncharacterized membrane protein (UPF0127 family)